MTLPWGRHFHSKQLQSDVRQRPNYSFSTGPDVCDFAQTSGGDVVDEAADSDALGNPGMSAELLQLVADIFINVLEGVEEGGSNSGRPGVILDSGAQVLLAGLHQAAIGVIDNHDFLSAQQIVGYHQRAQRVLRNDASGIANDVRVSRAQPQSANGKPGIHAGQDRKSALGTRRLFAQFMRARIDFVCCDHFVNGAHGRIV